MFPHGIGFGSTGFGATGATGVVVGVCVDAGLTGGFGSEEVTGGFGAVGVMTGFGSVGFTGGRVPIILHCTFCLRSSGVQSGACSFVGSGVRTPLPEDPSHARFKISRHLSSPTGFSPSLSGLRSGLYGAKSRAPEFMSIFTLSSNSFFFSGGSVPPPDCQIISCLTDAIITSFFIISSISASVTGFLLSRSIFPSFSCICFSSNITTISS